MNSKQSHDPMHRRTSDQAAFENCANPVSASELTCGAKTRAGAPCRNIPMKNGRCRMHGGGSTGPKTAAGIARHRAAVTIHGGKSRSTGVPGPHSRTQSWRASADRAGIEGASMSSDTPDIINRARCSSSRLWSE